MMRLPDNSGKRTGQNALKNISALFLNNFSSARESKESVLEKQKLKHKEIYLLVN
jgi:hypothetical protein